MFHNQNNKKKYYVFRKIRPQIGRRIRFGRRLHVNQPYSSDRLSDRNDRSDHMDTGQRS